MCQRSIEYATENSDDIQHMRDLYELLYELHQHFPKPFHVVKMKDILTLEKRFVILMTIICMRFRLMMSPSTSMSAVVTYIKCLKAHRSIPATLFNSYSDVSRITIIQGNRFAKSRNCRSCRI